MQFQYKPPASSKLDIFFKDDDYLVVNKPAGLLSVPGKGEDKQDCLLSRITIDFSDALIVHRLDMDTSGLMVLARNKKSHRLLSDLFQYRKIDKEYIAVVEGLMLEDEGEINSPLITDWPNRPKQKIDLLDGKPSTTFYRVMERDTVNLCCRVKLRPITGRSHQLRVHMQSLGHAILGDNLYASEQVRNKSTRLLLHASLLEFTHPITDKFISCKNDAPF